MNARKNCNYKIMSYKKQMLGRGKKGLEGLPLYLIITVIIAAIALAIVLNIIIPLERPNLASIYVTPQQINVTGIPASSNNCPGNLPPIKVYAYGQNNKPLASVKVTLYGYSPVDYVGITDSSGVAIFSSIVCFHSNYTYTYTITVKAQYYGTANIVLYGTILVHEPAS